MDVQREAFLILGTAGHESSAMADMLVKLGASPPQTPFLAAPAIGVEHWKSRPIADLNAEILASAGSSWSDWRSFNGNWGLSPVAEAFRKRAVSLVTSEFGTSGSFVLQDGMMSKLLPFWLGVLAEMNIAPKPILSVRQPHETARFSQTRQALPFNRGLLLWLRDMLDAEHRTREVARSIIAWDLLKADWRAAADKVSSELGVFWARSGDRSAAEIDELFIEVRRDADGGAEPGSTRRDVPELLDAAFQALMELSRNPQSNSARVQLDEIRNRFETSAALFGLPMMDVEIAIEKLNSNLKIAESKMDIMGLELEDSLKKLSAVELSLEKEKTSSKSLSEKHASEILLLSCEKDALKVRLFELQSEIDGAKRDRDSIIAEQLGLIQTLRTENDGLQQQKRELQHTLDNAMQDNARTLADVQAEMARLASEREALQHELHLAHARMESAAQEHSQRLENEAAQRADLIARQAALEQERDSLHVQFSHERAELDRRIEDLQARLVQSAEEHAGSLAAEHAKLAALAADHDGLRHAWGERNQRVEALQAQMEESARQHAESLAAEHARLATLASDTETLRLERDERDRRIESLQADLAQSERERVDSLAAEQARLASLAADHEALRLERDERNHRIEALQAQLEQAAHEHAGRLASLAADHEALRLERDERNHRIEALQAQQEQAAHEHAGRLASLAADHEALRLERDERNHRIEALQAQLQQAADEHDRAKVGAELKHQALNAERDALGSQVNEFQRQLEDARAVASRQNEDFERALADAQERTTAAYEEKKLSIEALEKQLGDAAVETIAATTARDAAVARGELLQSELEQMRLAQAAMENSLWFRIARRLRRSRP